MKTFGEFVDICEAYVPLRTSDKPYDSSGDPTETPRFSRTLSKAQSALGMVRQLSGYGILNPIEGILKGTAAARRLEGINRELERPESQRRAASTEISQRNKDLGANRRRLQTSMDRQNLTRSLRGSGSLEGTGGSIGHQPGDRYGIGQTGLAD